MTDIDLFRSRWRGQAGRLEVWYTTLTDHATGTGIWLHHELVAPADGAPAYGHGWIGVYPPDAEPVMAAFGPGDWSDPAGDHVFECAGAAVTPARLTGSAGEPERAGSAGGAGLPGATETAGRAAGSPDATEAATGTPGEIVWDLTATGGGPPLFTFPEWAWRREALPAAQIVPAPAASFTGTVHIGGSELRLADAPGATGHIYGHGNALRWAWLHADLGGGDVLEIVAAVSARPGMRLLRPLPFVRLRVDGLEWPAADPLLAAWRFRAHIGLPRWGITGRSGGRRLRVAVEQPPERTLAVAYRGPDGRASFCHNSERSDAVVTLERRTRGTWTEERSWTLAGTAHAEVGLPA